MIYDFVNCFHISSVDISNWSSALGQSLYSFVEAGLIITDFARQRVDGFSAYGLIRVLDRKLDQRRYGTNHQ